MIGRRFFIVFLTSISLYTAVADSHAADDMVFTPQLSQALQETLQGIKEILKTDNISASLYISDRCYWEGAAGVTRQNSDVPVHSDMLFGFGSITKTFVAGIVLQLAEENRLSLEDPLGRWLPQYPNIDPNITIRRLLNHGSGLNGYYRSKRYQREIEANPDRVWQPEDILKYVSPPRKIGFEALRYTNTNYILLGMIIETISGNSLAEELKNRITDPLRLDNTYLPKKHFDPSRWADNTKLSNSRFSSVWAAGAIASVPREIAKWSHALYSGNFLKPASLQSMLVTEPRRISRIELPMGLGVWKIEGEKMTAWGHGGKFHPFLSATLYLPDLEISVAHSYNWSDASGQFLPSKHLIETYIDNRPQDISMCFNSEHK